MSRGPAPDIAAIFDREAASWDRAHGPDSARVVEFAARAAYLRTLCTALDRPRTIDLGCGTGRQLIDLVDSIDSGMGLDLSAAMIAVARDNAARLAANAQLEFRVGDIAEARPEILGRYGLALFVGSLEHAPDIAQALLAGAGLLTADGRLVVIMPHPWNPRVLMARRAGDGAPFRHLTPRRLTALAEHTGLRLEKVDALPYRPGRRAGASRTRRMPIVAGAYAARFALA